MLVQVHTGAIRGLTAAIIIRIPDNHQRGCLWTSGTAARRAGARIWRVVTHH